MWGYEDTTLHLTLSLQFNGVLKLPWTYLASNPAYFVDEHLNTVQLTDSDSKQCENSKQPLFVIGNSRVLMTTESFCFTRQLHLQQLSYNLQSTRYNLITGQLSTFCLASLGSTLWSANKKILAPIRF